MKFAVLLLAVCLLLGIVSAIENRTGGRLVNRPKIDIFGPRQRRSPYEGVKGGTKGGVRVHPLFDFTPPSRRKQPELRKGEYVCGDKVCKLKPGVEPEGCNGICQYPLL